MDVVVVDEVVGNHELALQVWASGGGNGSEVERFIDAALGDVESVRTVARGKEIQNEAVVRHLKEIGHVASHLDDLRSELHCCDGIPEPEGELNREERTKDEGDAHKVATEDSAFSTQGSSSTALQIVPFVANSVIPASNTSLQESRHVISREISKQILACYTGAKNLREALEHEKLAYHQSTRTDTRETSSYPTEPKVYGRDEKRDSIISKLTSTEEEEEEEESCTGQNLAVIAIFGHGGVGKTTLAKVVFNHPAVSKHFDARLWVYVSSYFDQNKIMREMLESLLGDNSHDENTKELKDLQEKLAYALKHKRVLLILDDMWEDSQKEKWVELLTPLLSNGVEGNRIIITTRKISVLKLTGAKQHINLKGLEKKDFWDLFTECAFGVVRGENNYPKLKSIGQKIVPRLKGNPLAAKCVGRALRRKLDVGYWTRVLDNSEWKYQTDDSDIMPCLMVSYKHLPVHLQQCFSYCAMFPKYHGYEKEQLISIWIAQGLIPSTSTDMHRRLEDIGSEFFSDLIDLGFLETQFGFGRLLVMHDLIHDLAQSISCDESFTVENNNQLGKAAPPLPPLVRHVSVVTRSGYETQLDGTVRLINEHFLQEFLGSFGELQSKKLRTLMLFGPHDLDFATTFQREFSEVRSVRVLKLDMVVLCLGSMIGNISQLVNLRYMELDCFYRGSTLELPEAICGLRYLQVLDIRNWGDNTVLPRGMNQLVNLRNFFAREALHAKISSIGDMISLQELRAFGVREANSEFSISQLGKLNQLRGSLWIYNLYNVGSQDEAMEAKVCEKIHLDSLHLSWHGVLGEKVGTRNKLPLLEVLRPHANLLNLRIEAYNRPAPSWLLSSNSHLTSLRSLYLDNCLRWRTIPHPGQFPQLRELHLINMGLDKIEIGCLEVLELRSLQRLRQCIVLDKKQLSENLQVLEVVECPYLEELPLQASISTDSMQSECCQFTCLRRLRVHGYFGHISAFKLLSIDSLYEINLQLISRYSGCLQSDFKEFQLQYRGPSYDGLRMRIQGNKRVSTMTERLFQFIKKLRNLLDLEITDYPDLTYLAWEGLQQLTSLKKFKIIRCHKLFSGSVELILPPSVRELEFHSCNITGRQLSQLLLNPVSLKNLDLTNCEGVTTLPVGLFTDEDNQTAQGSSWHIPPDCMKSLESLQISFGGGSPDDAHSKMVFSSQKGLGKFKNLKNLVIENCHSTLRTMISGGASEIPPSSLLQLDLSSMDDKVLQFSELSSLVKLNLFQCRYLTCVSLDCCTALQELKIQYCELLAPLEGLQSCEALRHLSIHNCDTLPSLGGALPRTLATLNLESNRDLACLDLHLCTALQELRIQECATLASLEGLESLAALEKLYVQESPGFAKSWLSAAVVQVEGELRDHGYFPRTLQELDIDDTSVLCGPICSQLTSLKTLIIHGALNSVVDYMMDDDALEDSQERALLLLTSLRVLQFDRFEHLRSLPAELKALASLEVLSLESCPGVTSLSAGGLPASLKHIDICGCSLELDSHCREVNTDQSLCLTVDGIREKQF